MRFLCALVVGLLIGVATCTGINFLINDRGQESDFSDSHITLNEQSSLSSQETLQEILDMESPANRHSAALSLIVEMEDVELSAFIKESVIFERNQKLYSIQKIAIETLAHSNPKEALALLWEIDSHRWRDLISVVFNTWSLVNQEDAISAANTLDLPFRIDALRVVLTHDNVLLEDDSLSAILQNENDAVLQQLVKESRLMKLNDNPEKALQLFFSNEFDGFRRGELLTQLTEEWIQLHGFTNVLPLIGFLPDFDNEDRHYVNLLAREIALHDPKKTWDYLLSLPREIQHQIRFALFSVWSQIDPKQALSVLSKQEYTPFLSPNFNQLISAWAEEAPMDLVNNLVFFPQPHQEEVISYAVMELVQAGMISEAEQIIQKLGSEGKSVERATFSFVDGLARTDPEAAVMWTLAKAELTESGRNRLLSIALPSFAVVNSERAMEIAQQLSYDEGMLFSGPDDSVIFGLTSQGRLTEANHLIERVREPFRMRSYTYLGTAYIEFDQPDQAITLAQNLNESEQMSYFQTILHPWVQFHPDHVVDTLGGLPSAILRNSVAETILSREYLVQYLSPEQVAFVSTFLNPDSVQ